MDRFYCATQGIIWTGFIALHKALFGQVLLRYTRHYLDRFYCATQGIIWTGIIVLHKALFGQVLMRYTRHYLDRYYCATQGIIWTGFNALHKALFGQVLMRYTRHYLWISSKQFQMNVIKSYQTTYSFLIWAVGKQEASTQTTVAISNLPTDHEEDLDPFSSVLTTSGRKVNDEKIANKTPL